jgi:hypothetical protein
VKPGFESFEGELHCNWVLVKCGVVGEFEVGKAYLLHFKHQFVNCAGFWGELAAVPNWHRTGDVGGVTVPFAASVDEQNLWVKLLGAALTQRITVVVIVRFHGPP